MGLNFEVKIAKNCAILWDFFELQFFTHFFSRLHYFDAKILNFFDTHMSHIDIDVSKHEKIELYKVEFWIKNRKKNCGIRIFSIFSNFDFVKFLS